jgi:hypothetical protein
VQSFAIAWHVPATRRRALRAAVDKPRCLEALVGELLADASALALEVQQPEFARWCYEFCEKAVARAEDRPSWRTIEPHPSILEAIALPAAEGLSAEALVWWCLDLRPLRDDEISGAGRQPTARNVIHLAIRVAEAFVARDVADRERAGVLAVLAAVVARWSHASEIPVPDSSHKESPKPYDTVENTDALAVDMTVAACS